MNNLAPFVRVFTNTLGNGRWFDSFVNDLLPTVLGSAVCTGTGTDAAAGVLFGGELMSGSLQRGVAFAAAIVLLAALGWTILKPAGQYRVTAYFTGTVGLYPGSDVRILGIDVGEIERRRRRSATRSASRCSSTTSTTSRPTPTPSSWPRRWSRTATCSSPRCTTAGRRWRTAPRCRWSRTATPVELDQVYGALDELSDALGPDGANQNGALSDLVDVGAANLDGNGAALNRTLTGFSQAVETLATHRDDLFSSLDNLQIVHQRAGHDRRPGGCLQRQHGGGGRPARRRAAGPRRRVLAARPGAGRRRRLRPGQHRPASPPTSTSWPT